MFNYIGCLILKRSLRRNIYRGKTGSRTFKALGYYEKKKLATIRRQQDHHHLVSISENAYQSLIIIVRFLKHDKCVEPLSSGNCRCGPGGSRAPAISVPPPPPPPPPLYTRAKRFYLASAYQFCESACGRRPLRES